MYSRPWGNTAYGRGYNMCKGPEVGWSLLGWRNQEEPEGAGTEWTKGKGEGFGVVSRGMTMMTMRSGLVFRVPSGGWEGNRLWEAPTREPGTGRSRGSWGKNTSLSQYISDTITFTLFLIRKTYLNCAIYQYLQSSFINILAFKLLFIFGMTCRIYIKMLGRGKF